jgi:putative NADPH-quinone reductase
MPFSLTNTPAIFQAYINKVFSRLVDYFVVIYLNDILIYSKLGEDHYAYVRIVIERLRKHKLYTKFSKCFFNVKEVEFLGFIIGSIGVKPDPDRILTIKKWPKPKLFYEV